MSATPASDHTQINSATGIEYLMKQEFTIIP